MSWRIEYTDNKGVRREHVNRNNQSDAEGWGRSYAEKHGQATVVHVADGPYDYSGKVTHVVTYGDKKAGG